MTNPEKDQETSNERELKLPDDLSQLSIEELDSLCARFSKPLHLEYKRRLSENLKNLGITDCNLRIETHDYPFDEIKLYISIWTMQGENDGSGDSWKRIERASNILNRNWPECDLDLARGEGGHYALQGYIEPSKIFGKDTPKDTEDTSKETRKDVEDTVEG